MLADEETDRRAVAMALKKSVDPGIRLRLVLPQDREQLELPRSVLCLDRDALPSPSRMVNQRASRMRREGGRWTDPCEITTRPSCAQTSLAEP